jgi:hypothetical protein
MLLGSCLAGGLPPSRGEIGPSLLQSKRGIETGYRATAATSLGSATTRDDLGFDVSVGYAYERVEDSSRDITVEKAPGEALGPRVSHSFYGEYAQRISPKSQKSKRTWLGLRAGYVHSAEQDGGDGVEALGRVKWEVFAPADGSGGGATDCGAAAGVAYGTIGFGAYVEGGGRMYFDGERALVASVGLQLRLPAIFGVVVDFCAAFR